MDCISNFSIFFFRKKTFNLIWEKIRTFEALCIEFIKEVFIWVSLIFCVGKAFIMEGIKSKFSKFSNEHEFGAIIIMY